MGVSAEAASRIARPVGLAIQIWGYSNKKTYCYKFLDYLVSLGDPFVRFIQKEKPLRCAEHGFLFPPPYKSRLLTGMKTKNRSLS
jgi:hypothetical protein